MESRYRIIRRGLRRGAYYCVDTQTGQRTSLGTTDEDEARQIVHAKNQAERQPLLNLELARAYLSGSDSATATRTWSDVMVEFLQTKTGPSRERYERAIADHAYDGLRKRTLMETRPEHFLHALRSGGVSTNNHLRRFHNFALDLGWLLRPVLPKRQWPAVRYKQKRAITRAEHDLILSREPNAELRAFLWCCWHLGGSQTDVASLKAEDIEWDKQVVSFFRRKTGTAQVVRFGKGFAEVLRGLSQVGFLFPTLSRMDAKHRAAGFNGPADGSSSRACRCIPTVTCGRSGPNAPAIRSVSPRRHWDITRLRFTGPTRAMPDLNCLRWRITNSLPSMQS